MNIDELERIDTNGMYKVYEKWPEIAREHYNLKLKKIEFSGISHIVFAGMGGSGAISDIFAAILSKTKIHVDVVKGYLLPKTVDSNSLVVTTSISGNTEETLSVLSEAHKSKCKIIAFSDNGKVEKFCRENDVEHKKIPMIHSPRASFPAFLFAMIRVLEPYLQLGEKDVEEAIIELEKQKIKISHNNLSESNQSINLAKWISDVPLIYYPWGLQASATRFKNSLQENAKMHAITEDIIEACHNGIVSWENNSEIKPILIQGKDDFIKTKERWEILKEFFDEKNIEYKEIHSINGNILSKIINLIYFLDYTTIYKAILSNVDPTPVKPIDFVKKKLIS